LQFNKEDRWFTAFYPEKKKIILKSIPINGVLFNSGECLNVNTAPEIIGFPLEEISSIADLFRAAFIS
jgi:hypothetical protein